MMLSSKRHCKKSNRGYDKLTACLIHEILKFLCVWDVNSLALTGDRTTYEACNDRRSHKTNFVFEHSKSLVDKHPVSEFLNIYEGDVQFPHNIQDSIACFTQSFSSSQSPDSTVGIRMWNMVDGKLTLLGCANREAVQKRSSHFLGLRIVKDESKVFQVEFHAVGLEDGMHTRIDISLSMVHQTPQSEVNCVSTTVNLKLSSILSGQFLMSSNGAMFAVAPGQRELNGSLFIYNWKNDQHFKLEMDGILKIHHGQHSSSQHWSRDFSKFAISTELEGGGSKIWVWCMKSGDLIQKIPLPPLLDKYLVNCSFTSDGSYIFLNPSGYSVFALFSIKSGQLVLKHKCFERNLQLFPKDEEDQYETVDISPDGSLLMLLESSKLCCQSLALNSQKAVGTTPAHQAEQRIVFYETCSGRLVTQQRFKEQIGGCTFTGDGKTVVVWPYEDFPGSHQWFQIWKLNLSRN
mmetsp:Transcript_33932/g.44765  ORF Transcript_33932/g.44765 Transcript_33932/m.44765 type:complete len:462 (+) Transcript_33932:186-1571(+)